MSIVRCLFQRVFSTRASRSKKRRGDLLRGRGRENREEFLDGIRLRPPREIDSTSDAPPPILFVFVLLFRSSVYPRKSNNQISPSTRFLPTLRLIYPPNPLLPPREDFARGVSSRYFVSRNFEREVSRRKSISSLSPLLLLYLGEGEEDINRVLPVV